MERKQLIAELEANGYEVHEEHPFGDPQIHLIVKRDGTVVDELTFDADDPDLMKKKADGPAGWHRGKGYSGETSNPDVDFSAPNSDDFQEHNPGLDRADQELPDTKPIEFKSTEDEYMKGRQVGIIPNDESDRGSRGGYSLGSKGGDDQVEKLSELISFESCHDMLGGNQVVCNNTEGQPHAEIVTNSDGVTHCSMCGQVYEPTEKTSDVIPGGIADNMADEMFDPKQLQMGIEVEMEHTNDPEKAKEIAKDHLTELSDYYTRLKEMEKKVAEVGLPKGWSVEFEQERWNEVIQATVPEGWVVRDSKGYQMAWGDSKEEAIKNSQSQADKDAEEDLGIVTHEDGTVELPDGSGFAVGTVGSKVAEFQVGQVWKDPGSGDLMTIRSIDETNDKMNWQIQTPDDRIYEVNPTLSGMKEELKSGNIVKVAEEGGESSSSVPFNPETYKELKDRGLTSEEPGQSLRQSYEPIEASLEKIGMEIGDKVKCKIDGSIGEVIGVPQNKSEVEQGYFVSVRWESGEEDLMGVEMLEKVAMSEMPRFAVGEPDDEEKEADGYSYEETQAPKVSESEGHFYVDVDNELGLWVIKSTDNPSLVIESHPTLDQAKARMIELNGGSMITADSEICSNCGGDGYVDGRECPACEGTGRLPKSVDDPRGLLYGLPEPGGENE